MSQVWMLGRRAQVANAKPLAMVMATAAMAAITLAVMSVALAFGGAQSAWAVQDLAAGNLDAQAGAQVSTQSDPLYLDDEKEIYVTGLTDGSATYDSDTKTITLDNLKADALSIVSEGRSYTLEFNGASTLANVDSQSNLKVVGSGSLTVTSSFYVNECDLVMTEGTIQGAVRVGFLNMKGGIIKGSGKSAEIESNNGMTMSNGAISLSNSTADTAITVFNGDFNMTGGSLSVTNTKHVGLDVNNYVSATAKNSGEFKVTGGTVVITVADPATGWAIYTSRITNKLGCLKTISGCLSYGAQFKVGKNLYQVIKGSSQQGKSTVQLAKYNSTVKKAKVGTVTYGKHSYQVTRIGAGAFSTNAGKKVTSISITSKVTVIGKNAFANTKALKTLYFKNTNWIKRVYGKNNKLKSLKVAPGCSVAKKAFAKAGKNGGGQLTVKLGKKGVKKSEAKKYKAFLTSKGLPSAAKLKTF